MRVFDRISGFTHHYLCLRYLLSIDMQESIQIRKQYCKWWQTNWVFKK